MWLTRPGVSRPRPRPQSNRKAGQGHSAVMSRGHLSTGKNEPNYVRCSAIAEGPRDAQCQLLILLSAAQLYETSHWKRLAIE